MCDYLHVNIPLLQVVSMADYDISRLSSERHLLIVTSTFGSGDPPQHGQVRDAHSQVIRLWIINYKYLKPGSHRSIVKDYRSKTGKG